MADVPKLTGEVAEGPYALVVRVPNNGGVAAGSTFAAQARKNAGDTGTPLATFTVAKVDGSSGDAGYIVVTLSLTQAQVEALPSVVACDLTQAVGSAAAVPILRWALTCKPTVTR